jgi:hypothetical protein
MSGYRRWDKGRGGREESREQKRDKMLLQQTYKDQNTYTTTQQPTKKMGGRRKIGDQRAEKGLPGAKCGEGRGEIERGEGWQKAVK